MCDPDRFNKESIDMRILDSQIIYQSGYVTGIKEVKDKIINQINQELHAARLMVDSLLYQRLLSLKTYLETL